MKINVEEVEQGKNENWLIVKCHIGQFDVNRLFTFEFCGTELNGDAALTEEDRKIFRDYLCEKYGYAPYRVEQIETETPFIVDTEVPVENKS